MYHKSQIFFYLLASFLSGIFIASIFNISQTFIYGGLVVALGLIGIFGYKKNFNKPALLAGFIIITFLFGVIRFNSVNLNNNRLNVFADLKAGDKNIEIVVSGYVDDEPVNNGEYQRVILRAKKIVAGDRVVLVDDRVLITVNNFPKFDYGDTISAKGALQKPQNLDEFDYITYLKKQSIKTTMFFPDLTNEYYDSFSPVRQAGIYPNMGVFEKAKISLYQKIFLLKARFESAVGRLVPEPNASFINGILLGSRQNIPNDLEKAFNKTGTTHILAISGYNIMIVSWAILSGLVWFFKRRVAFWISVMVVVLFTVLTGASSSVVRASIMGLLVLFSYGYGRLYNPKNSIILAGAVMVWLNPFVLVFDIGFQLSFVAVLGLMYLYPKIDRKLKRAPKLGNLKEIVLMTLSAQIAVAPLLIYYFKNFSVVSLPANIMILPFIPVAMFTGFISGLTGMIFLSLGPFGQIWFGVSQIVGWFAWAITTYQIGSVELLARLF